MPAYGEKRVAVFPRCRLRSVYLVTTSSRKKRSNFDESSEAKCQRKLTVLTVDCQGFVPDNKKYRQNCGVHMTVSINERDLGRHILVSSTVMLINVANFFR